MTIDPQLAAMLLLELIKIIRAAKEINVSIADFDKAAGDVNAERKLLDSLIQKT